MEIRELIAQPREGVGKGFNRRLRRAGRVPAVLYGSQSPANLSLEPRDVLRLTQGHARSTQLLRLDFGGGGGGARMAIIRDMQFHPVTDALLHVDLQEVAMDRAIQVSVALRHVGEAIGIKEDQGVLEMVLREVQVSCLPGAIPEAIEADVSNLRIGDVFTVSSLTVPAGVRVLNDPGQAVALVSPPMKEEVPAEVVAEVEAAEPEVLTERKAKEEDEDKDEKKK
jgi:large subunit ribosomal protein L25